MSKIKKKLLAALIILYDSDKRFLLQHRTVDAMVMPNYWAFFGGGIKKGENPRDAAIREAYEELNYSTDSLVLFFEQSFQLHDTDGYMYVFVDRFYGKKTFLKLNEGQGWGWFNLAETSGLMMIDHDRFVIQCLAAKLNSGLISE